MAMQARAEVHFIIDQAIANMRTLENQARATGSTLGSAFTGTEKDLASYNDALNTVGRNLTLFGAGVTGAVGMAVNAAGNFEAQMSAVSAVSNATAEDMDKLSDAALRIGADTTLSATEVGAAMEILAKAGISVEDIYSGVAEGVVRLSEATGASIETSAETAAAALTVFGLTAEDTDRVMNVVAQSANASMLDVDDWTAALTYAGPIVATLGMEIEDLAQMMVILGNQGIRGSVAATSIRNILTQLTDSASPATEALTAAGVSIYDTNNEMRSMEDILTDLVPAWNDMDDAAKAQFATQAFGVRGGPAFLAMMNSQAEAVGKNSSAFDEANDAMLATGDIYSMSAERMNNMKGAIERLSGAVESMMISFGSRLTPAISMVADVLSVVVEAFTALPGPIQTVIAFATAAVGILSLLGGGFLLLLPQIFATQQAMARLGGMRGVLQLLVSPIRAIGVAMLSALAPALPIIIALAAAAGLLYLAWRTNFLNLRGPIESVVGWLKDLWGWFSDIAGPIASFLGLDFNKDASLDITSSSDEAFDAYSNMEDGLGKKANLEISTLPDDMFIEYVYGADGSVIAYDVKITSSTDGTEQTGRILSSSVDESNPDLIHMEVQLESGETVTGVYNEIDGKFSQIDGNVNVGATFIGDAYTIVKETLPDGTKKWNIVEDETGGTFGEIIESYTTEGGETFILIQPEGDGEAFWAKTDLETGAIESVQVDIEGQPGAYYGTLTAITSATGNEVMVAIDGDGRPIAGEIESIIRDPNTGDKFIELRLGNGELWVAEVDAVTGSIQLVREVEVTADTSEVEKRIPIAVQLWEHLGDAISSASGWVADFAEAFWFGDFGKMGELLEPVWSVVEKIGSAWSTAMNNLMGYFTNAEGYYNIGDTWEQVTGFIEDIALKWGNALTALQDYWGWFKDNVLNYDENKSTSADVNMTPDDVSNEGTTKYQRDDTGVGTSPGSNYANPYNPMEGGNSHVEIRDISELGPTQKQIDAMNAWSAAGMVMNESGGAARKSVSDLFGAIRDGHEPTSQSVIDMNLMASSAPPMGLAVDTAGKQIKGSGLDIEGSFQRIAAAATTQTLAASLASSTNFTALRSAITTQSASAASNASSQFGTMGSNIATRMSGMNSDVSSRMSAIRSTIATRSSESNSTASSNFMTMNRNVGSQFSSMLGSSSSNMSSLSRVVSSQSSAARANAVSEFSSMSSSAAGKFSGMQAKSAVQLALMAGSAKTQGSATASNLTGALMGAQARTAIILGAIPGIVTNMGSAASSNAYSAGANISLSFANGMYAYLGSIRSAANAMVSAANAAVLAKAMISSPSRMAQYWADMIGIGFVDTLESYAKPAASAAAMLINEPVVSRDLMNLIDSGAAFGTSADYASGTMGASGSTIGGATVIDQSTHTTEVKYFSESDLKNMLKNSEKGVDAYNYQNDPNSLAAYGGN